MSSHRREVRPRYGRIGFLVASITVSGVAALGGFGLLPTSSAQPSAGQQPAASTGGGDRSTSRLQTPDTQTPDTQSTDSADTGSQTSLSTEGNSQTADIPDPKAPKSADSTSALPAESGSGKRIVFDQSDQRVWLVGSAADHVLKTYLVSGSVTDNLQPGTYSVYSKSRWAVGIDDSGVMQYFVRFTQGPTGAAIGFHSIPTKNGVALQTRAQLGTPQSHGCIRQYLPDAIALWNFAPVGTKVVVVA